jgi:hypothetical protein
MMTCSPVDPLPAPVIEPAAHRAGVALGSRAGSREKERPCDDFEHGLCSRVGHPDHPQAPTENFADLNDGLNSKFHALS